MDQDGFTRKYLSISSVSVLGSCEMKFLDAIMGRTKQTTAMKAGKEAHERLAARLPKITKEEVINQIKSGMPLQVRELSVFDSKTRICGRIDQLRMTGTFEGHRHTGIIIDDKYPKDPNLIHGLTLYYKLQLSSYAVALENSDQYGSLCKVVGAELIYREKATDKVIKSYEMDRKRLGDCTSNVGAAVDDAWSLYQKKKEAEHRRFDVERGEWVGCYCKSIAYG